jgi:hypothetical protein
MPNPFANTGGGPGGPDDSFLGLDSGNFWSRFGLPDPMAQKPMGSPMGPVDAMPTDEGTPMPEAETVMPSDQDPSAPLDALYSMIGMQPLTADSMGRYNLTEDQKKSASRNALADTLGTAAQVMFGSADASDMVKAGVGFGARRDASLDKSSATNEKDYATKVDMAIKGSNLLRQQTIIEAEQEKLQSIMEQKEYGAHWVETMTPVWEKYANKLSTAGDPDKAGEYAAALTMVKSKALAGDMAGATTLFDAANKQMIPGVWEDDVKEDAVRAQFARTAEYAGFADADAALQAAMPGWKMGMVQGKAVPMSPQDQAREAAAIDTLKAQAQNYREVSGSSREQTALFKMQTGEVNRITKLADDGLNALGSALQTIGSGRNEKNATAYDKAQGNMSEYISYLEAGGALDTRNPSTYQKQIELLMSNPSRLKQAIVAGARASSPILMQLSAMGAGQGAGNPAAAAGAGGPRPQSSGMNVGADRAFIENAINTIGTPGGNTPDQVRQMIKMTPSGAIKAEMEKKLFDHLSQGSGTASF